MRKNNGSDENDHTAITTQVQQKQKPAFNFKDANYNITNGVIHQKVLDKNLFASECKQESSTKWYSKKST